MCERGCECALAGLGAPYYSAGQLIDTRIIYVLDVEYRGGGGGGWPEAAGRECGSWRYYLFVAGEERGERAGSCVRPSSLSLFGLFVCVCQVFMQTRGLGRF